MKYILIIPLMLFSAYLCPGKHRQNKNQKKPVEISLKKWQRSAINKIEKTNVGQSIKDDYKTSISAVDSLVFDSLLTRLKNCSDTLSPMQHYYIFFSVDWGEIYSESLHIIAFNGQEACQVLLVNEISRKEYYSRKYKDNEFLIDTLFRTNHNLNGSELIFITKVSDGKYTTDYVSIGADILIDRILSPENFK